MSKHEHKYCPCCGSLFECKPGNITQCQCYGISFSEEERKEIEKRYGDCLCRKCLDALKNEFNLETKPIPLQKNI